MVSSCHLFLDRIGFQIAVPEDVGAVQQDGAEHDRNRSAFFCGWGINVGQGRRFGLVQALNAQGGSREQRGKDGGMCARNGDFGREVLKRQGYHANTGGTGKKKSQPDQGWDFTLWWRWAESNRRPKVLHPRPYMLILAVRSRRRAARQAKRTRKPVC